MAVPHLWDGAAVTASAYELGIRHLGVFVVDRAGAIRAVFDDQIPNLVGPVLPAVRAALVHPAGRPLSTGSTARPPRPAGAFRPSAAGPRDRRPHARPVDRGSARRRRRSQRGGSPERRRVPHPVGSPDDLDALAECRLRSLASRQQRVGRGVPGGIRPLSEPPRHREPERPGRDASRARSEPIRSGSRRSFCSDGTPTTRRHSGAFRVAAAEAAAGRDSSSTASRSSVRPTVSRGRRSRWSHRFGRVRGFMAVPRWERRIASTAGPDQTQTAQYRQTVAGASIDVGAPGALDPRFELPTPLGLRAGYLSVGDDQRTLPAPQLHPSDSVGRAGMVPPGKRGPWRGITGDVEYVGWHLDSAGKRRSARDAAGYRAGLRVEEPVGPMVLWGAAHRLRSDRDFAPAYGSITYEANREGWRAWAGLRRLETRGGTPGTLGDRPLLSRGPRDRRDHLVRRGRSARRVASVSLSARPARRPARGGARHLQRDRPPAEAPDLTTRGSLARPVLGRARDIEPSSGSTPFAGTTG